jgi:PhnB protein
MAKQKVKAIPDGYHTITPYLTVRDARALIDFYKRAFGAEELAVMYLEDGGPVMHAELTIGDSRFFLGEEAPAMNCKSPLALGGTPSGLALYVTDIDRAWDRAIAAGAVVKQPLQLQFWGDRYGTLADPSGHVWSLAQHVEDVPPDEIERRGREAMRKMRSGGKPPEYAI